TRTSQIHSRGLLILRHISDPPGLDAKASADEDRKRINEELDYELEAQNQRALRLIYRGHPFIVIPDVMTRLSRERVLVTEYVEGTGFEEHTDYDQEARDRIAQS